MKNIVLITDTNADVLECYKKDIIYIPQYFKFESEQEYHEDMDRNDFYNKLFCEKVITSAPNIDLIKQTFENEILKGNDIICVSFSSKMSSTYNLFKITAEEVMDELNEHNPKIEVIDSLSAGPAQGMICRDILKMIENNLDFEDIIQTTKQNLDKYKVYFVVNDFKYLVQGGRVSQTVANIGKILNIKPILSIRDGSIQVVSKPRGIKNAFEIISNYIGDNYEEVEFIKISEEEISEEFEKYIKEKLNKNNIESIPLNLVTCAHLGPNSVALVVKIK